jgi:adenosylcobyric acid synthase
VVVRLPYLSNYDEFDALAADPRVHLRFAASPAEFPAHPDLIILPGTKNTLADLAWLWRADLAQHIRRCAQSESAILGICGGYQMLGERVHDEQGVEGHIGQTEPGLNLLSVETFFAPLQEKTTQRCEAIVPPSARRGLFAQLGNSSFQAYQIHLGRTVAVSSECLASVLTVDQSYDDGYMSLDGWCAGCYLHGLLENDSFRHGIVAALAARRSLYSQEIAPIAFSRQTEYDKLADVLLAHLDITLLKQVCDL